MWGDNEAPKALKSEAQRAENRGRRPRQVWGSCGRGGWPLPTSLEVWGSAVSSPSGVWGGAPAEIEFWHILA